MAEQLLFSQGAESHLRARVLVVLALGALGPACARLSDHCGGGPCPSLPEVEARLIAVEQERLFKTGRCGVAVEHTCDDGSITITRGDGYVATTEYFDERGRMVAARLSTDDGQTRRWGLPSKCTPVATVDLCAGLRPAHAQLGGTLKVDGASSAWLDGAEVEPSSFFVDAGTHLLTLVVGPHTVEGQLTARVDLAGAQWALLDAGASDATLRSCDALGRQRCEVWWPDRRQARLEWRARVRFPDGGVR